MPIRQFDEVSPIADENLKNIADGLRGVLHARRPNVREIQEGKLEFYFENNVLFGIVKFNNRLYRTTFTLI